MLRHALIAAAMAAATAACVPAEPPATAPVSPPATDYPREDGTQDQCDSRAAAALIGQKATAEAGARARDLTGARMLRWGPPDSAFTMDYSPWRVNVMYDRAMTITEITCG